MNAKPQVRTIEDAFFFFHDSSSACPGLSVLWVGVTGYPVVTDRCNTVRACGHKKCFLKFGVSSVPFKKVSFFGSEQCTSTK